MLRNLGSFIICLQKYTFLLEYQNKSVIFLLQVTIVHSFLPSYSDDVIWHKVYVTRINSL